MKMEHNSVDNRKMFFFRFFTILCVFVMYFEIITFSILICVPP